MSQPASPASSTDASYDTSPEVKSQGHFPFLSLPLEIRCQIYSDLLASGAEWIRPVHPWVAATMKRFPKQYMINPWPQPTASTNKEEYVFTSTKLDTNILLANKQILAEARDVLLRENPVFLTIDGRKASIRDDLRALKIMKHVRTLALRVDYYEEDAPWISILSRRTNLRTLRLRFMDRDLKITMACTWPGPDRAHFFELARGIRACALVTVECDGVNGPKKILGEESDDEVADRTNRMEDLNTWLKKNLTVHMREAGCSCAKGSDGRHVDRVTIGKCSA